MLPKKYRVYLVVFALLAFASQLFAAVELPCKDMGSQLSTTPVDAPIGMDHSHHFMPDEVETSGSDASAADCCGESQCSMSHCVFTSLAVVSMPAALQLPRAHILNSEYAVSFLSSGKTALFRPPISR